MCSYEFRTIREIAEDRRIHQEEVQKKHDLETILWRNFLKRTDIPYNIKKVFIEAYDAFLLKEYYNSDSILLRNYKMVARSAIAESFLRKLLDLKSCWLHPKRAELVKQLEISDGGKPVVGERIPRFIQIDGKLNGICMAYLSKHSMSSNRNPMLRITKYSGEWTAIGFDQFGIVTYLVEKPPVDWSHIEIIEVGPRFCRGIARKINIAELIQKAVLEHYKSKDKLITSKKIKVEVEW